jgi:ABC-type molybdenum transport system ATPase subunit/photorepair protein PhrA
MAIEQTPALIIEAGEPVADPTSAALCLRGVTISYGAKPAVFAVDMTVPRGSMMAIVGPNGAGKRRTGHCAFARRVRLNL